MADHDRRPHPTAHLVVEYGDRVAEMRWQFTAKLCWSTLVSWILFAMATTLLVGCYQLKIDTVPKWCDQIGGTNLKEKYLPFWAVFFAVSFHEDAIRDDFVAMMNEAHMQKVEHRSPRMAWREGLVFHLINLSTLMVIEPGEIVEKWRDGIEKAKTHSHTEEADACLYGTVVSLFDSMKIHSIEIDVLGQDKGDQVTTIETERAARAAKAKVKLL
jgi:hypothetical protein